MLTLSQKKAAWEIFKDLQKKRPMNRLLEGDVGSGKTVVAMLAMLSAAWNGYQTAFLAPTEILATQHFATFTKLLKSSGLNVMLLTRALRKVVGPTTTAADEQLTKKQAHTLLAQGDATVVIGTHALLEEAVQFKKLGLAIVDEQHRFGVEQRKELRVKAGQPLFPHFLSLTATPIPRTLALSVYGDLDLSLLTDKPVGRKPIKTRLVEPHNREKAYEFVKEQIQQGRQVFVVCPLIDASDAVGAKAVTTEVKRLQKEIFPGLKIEMLHGKMSAQEKEKRMAAFLHHEFDILVATSVVEVGVDIPNASVMMIEGAERFGLAQLHQFRGRVGRSDHQSFCLLFQSEDMPGPTKERLEFLQTCTDGFKLAEKDLELRGMGSLFGLEQSGFDTIRFADFKNPELIKKARETAQWVIDQGLEKFPTVEEQVYVMERDVHAE
jgi:ATP-dependent DNA helicase RecG